MKLRFVVNELYSYFDCKFYNKDFKIVKSKSDHVITDFLINVHKDFNLQSINYQFIFKYLVCQYDHWKDIEITGFGNLTRINNIFGQKAYNRFKTKGANSKFNWYNAEESLRDRYGISRQVLSRYIAKQKVNINALTVDEEREKTLFSDGNIQLVHCLDSTTLYNHASKHCVKCTANETCKLLLKRYYRDIYIDRGYEASIKKESTIKS